MADLTPEEKAAAEAAAKNKGANDDLAKIKSEHDRLAKENNDLIKELNNTKKSLTEKLDAEKAARDKELADQGKFKELSEAREKENKTLQEQLKSEKVNSALKVAALKANIVDIDGLKLADISKIIIDDKSGEVKGVDEVLKDLKEKKPFLFGAPGNGGGGGNNIHVDRLGEVDIRNLTPDQINAMTTEERRKVIAAKVGDGGIKTKSVFTIKREQAALAAQGK